MKMKGAMILIQNRKGYWRVYGALGKGCKGHPNGGESAAIIVESSEHFICNCLLVKTLRGKMHS